MIFPSLGDTDSYMQIGQAASDYVKNGGSFLNFQIEATSIRPLGAVIYNAIPYFLTNDTVLQEYIRLCMNLFFYFIAIIAVYKISETLFKDHHNTNALLAVSAILVTVFYLPHLPVLAMDIQPIALILLSIYFFMKIINRLNTDQQLSYADLFIALSLISVAGLLKQSWFVYGFGFIAIASLLQLDKNHMFKILKDKYFWLIVLIGSWGFYLQIYYVYNNFGDLWLIKRGGLDAYSVAYVYPNIAMFAYTKPMLSAYLLQSEPGTSHTVWMIQKLYIALFEFDVAVYRGYAPHFTNIFHTPMVSVLFMLLAELIVSLLLLVGVVQKNRYVRMISIISLSIILFQITSTHVEIRFYIVPRLLIFIISWYFLFRYFDLIKSFFIALILWSFLIFGVNMIIDNENHAPYCELIDEKVHYIHFQEKYMHDHNVKFNMSWNNNNSNTTCSNDGISLGEKMQYLQKMIDSNQKIIDQDVKNK